MPAEEVRVPWMIDVPNPNGPVLAARCQILTIRAPRHSQHALRFRLRCVSSVVLVTTDLPDRSRIIGLPNVDSAPGPDGQLVTAWAPGYGIDVDPILLCQLLHGLRCSGVEHQDDIHPK